MEKLLLNKNIILTGAAGGLGREMIDVFAKNGANIVVLVRQNDDEFLNFCNVISEKYSVNIWSFCFDLTNFIELKEVIDKIRNLRIKIDGLVNNAGISYTALFQLTSIKELKKQFEINFFAPYVLTQYISKIMVKSGGGSIVTISSSAALDCNGGKSAYASSKAAVLCMTRCISQELAIKGIRANVICPGIIKTNMVSSVPKYIIDIQKDASSLKQIGKPIDIANTALFLLSDKSSYITGQVIKVDGGVTQFNKRQ